MKLTATSLSLAAFLLFPIFAGAQVRETPVTLGLVEGGNPQGYVQGANEQGILFSTQQGATGQMVTYDRIRGEGLDKLIRFEERTEVLGPARALFSAGQFKEAADAFGKIARDYAIILNAPQNFATEALFYQIESLKRAGLYESMAPLVKLPVANTINTKLVEAYKRPFEFHKLWGLFGGGDIEALKTALEIYQEPQTGAEKLLSSPNFKKLPPDELAQLAFLRAKVYEKEGDTANALEDYYRCFTLGFGSDVLLSKLAMGAAMQIQRQDPRIASENKSAIVQLQSIAYFYSRRFGKDSMPPEFQEFAVMPDLPKPQLVEDAVEEEPGDGEKKEETPETEEGGEKKGEEEGKDEKPEQ